MKKAIAIVLGLFLSLFVTGTALAEIYNLADEKDRTALIDLLRSKGEVALPEVSLPELSVVVTIDFEKATAVVEGVGDGAPAALPDLEKVAKMVQTAFPSVKVTLYDLHIERSAEVKLSTMDGAKPEAVKEAEEPELPQVAETAAPASPVESEAPETATVPEAPEKVTGLDNALIQSHDQTPKEVGQAGLLQARDGKPGKEVVRSHETPSTPSVEDELAQRRAVQAQGLRVANHGMVEGVRNPLSLTLGANGSRGKR